MHEKITYKTQSNSPKTFRGGKNENEKIKHSLEEEEKK